MASSQIFWILKQRQIRKPTNNNTWTKPYQSLLLVLIVHTSPWRRGHYRKTFPPSPLFTHGPRVSSITIYSTGLPLNFPLSFRNKSKTHTLSFQRVSQPTPTLIHHSSTPSSSLPSPTSLTSPDKRIMHSRLLTR